jgi:hypothetical protein
VSDSSPIQVYLQHARAFYVSRGLGVIEVLLDAIAQQGNLAAEFLDDTRELHRSYFHESVTLRLSPCCRGNLSCGVALQKMPRDFPERIRCSAAAGDAIHQKENARKPV